MGGGKTILIIWIEFTIRFQISGCIIMNSLILESSFYGIATLSVALGLLNLINVCHSILLIHRPSSHDNVSITTGKTTDNSELE